MSGMMRKGFLWGLCGLLYMLAAREAEASLVYSNHFAANPLLASPDYEAVRRILSPRREEDLRALAQQDPWTALLAGSFMTAGSLDILASNTMSLQDFHGPTGKWNVYEADPLLGRFPSFIQYDFMAPALVGLAFGIALHLPEPIRIPFFIAALGYEGMNVLNMITTFGLSTFAFPEFIAGVAVGMVVTWAVYHSVSWIIDYFIPPSVGPDDLLRPFYEKIQELNQGLPKVRGS